ncbi:MAG: hypothetical protein WBB18_13600 [Nodosilinea sp.]
MAVPAQANNPSPDGYIQGNVDLAPGVAVAPGVLLGAAPGCRLVIAAGVCLGASAVVQARQGDLMLEIGVSLGSGVLVVGHGTIGQHTCIGANSTVINPSLGASQVLAPGSLVGDPSQPPLAQRQPTQAGTSVGRSPANNSGGAGGYVQGLGTSDQNGSQGGYTQPGFSNGGIANGSTGNGGALDSDISGGSTANGSLVYGKAHVNRLLATLFPHRQTLNGATPEDRP